MLFHILSSQKTIFSNDCDIQIHLRHSTGSTECLLLSSWPVITTLLFVSNTGTCAHEPQVFLHAKSLLCTPPLQFGDKNSHCHEITILCPKSIQTLHLQGQSALTLSLWETSFYCIYSSSSFAFLVTFLKVPSSSRPYKCFSTCLEHLAVVVFFYSNIMFMYMKPMNTKDYISNMVFTVLFWSHNKFFFSQFLSP